MSLVYLLCILIVPQLYFPLSLQSNMDPFTSFFVLLLSSADYPKPLVFLMNTVISHFQPISLRSPCCVCAVLTIKSRLKLSGWTLIPFPALVNDFNFSHNILELTLSTSVNALLEKMLKISQAHRAGLLLFILTVQCISLPVENCLPRKESCLYFLSRADVYL